MSRPTTRGRYLVMDTGALLVHALGAFENGRYVLLACGFLHEKDREQVSKTLFLLVNQILSTSVLKFVTPQALTELLYLIEQKLALRGRKLSELYPGYREMLIRLSDVSPAKNDLLESDQILKLGIADTSAILAADLKNATIITTDLRLAHWCKDNQRDALHLYNDIYLQSDSARFHLET